VLQSGVPASAHHEQVAPKLFRDSDDPAGARHFREVGLGFDARLRDLLLVGGEVDRRYKLGTREVR
jgi:hypothetical protein